MEEKINKIYILVIISLIFSFLTLLIIFLGSVSVSTNKSSNAVDTTSESSDYDTSMMANLTLDEVLNLFNDKNKTYVVYFGRENCSACVNFLPTLQKMQAKYGYTTQYLDIRTVDKESASFSALKQKLSKQVTLTVSGEILTQSFGDFYGYTPMVFIISNGKFADGIVGSYSEADFQEFLNNNNIK